MALNTERSSQWYKKAQTVLPGGVNSPVRAFKSVERDPIFIKKASGSLLVDEDENTYIDYIGSWGPAILGHGHEAILQGVYECLTQGTSYGLPTALEVEMAEFLTQALPSMEMVRMVCSGTEATMSALRLARGFTGRDKIIKFEGCYHGHSDGLLVKTGSGALTYGIPTSAGVTADVAKDTLVLEYNNLEQVVETFTANPHSIAAIILEPIPANMGILVPDLHFLKGLRELATQQGALLIFDEVITGFRIGFTGAQGYFDIDPDITCLGKIIGGGMPVGAYGGKKEIMSYVSPSGPVYQAGTLSGNPVAMKMGLNLLNYLKEHQEIYEQLEEKAIYLEQGFLKNFEATGIQGKVNRVGSLLSLFFHEGEVNSYAKVMESDTQKYAKYFKSMLESGIMLPPAQFEAMFLSQAHTKEQLDYTIMAHLQGLKKLLD
jgi:glutamate-1-semialdehyde 2,1-aminomutase